MEYRANLIRSLYGAFKKANVYFDVLNSKAQMQKKLELKLGYKAFKSFQAKVTLEQNFQLRSYKTGSQKTQSYQLSLLY